MSIGDVIRTYRKQKNLTQETVASRLGVSTSAVNKWEKGVSQPDILLLAPIARLLDITLDTLLCFEKEPTREEIDAFAREADKKLQTEPYADVFLWVKRIAGQYPNCHSLLWQLAVILDARRQSDDVPDAEAYDADLLALYTRALESADEAVRAHAADSLFHFHMRNGAYDKAEECLSYFSTQNPERKRKQADLYRETGRTQEAYKTLEELLFAGYQTMSQTLQGLYLLAMRAEDMEKAHMLSQKQRDFAHVLEMGKYHEASCGLELATMERDADKTLAAMEGMLQNLDSIYGFTKSPLYAHMDFRAPDEAYTARLLQDLLACFRDEETYGFLKDNPRYLLLTGEAK